MTDDDSFDPVQDRKMARHQEMVQWIKMMTKLPEEQICDALDKCDMDPDEALKLLSQAQAAKSKKKGIATSHTEMDSTTPMEDIATSQRNKAEVGCSEEARVAREFSSTQRNPTSWIYKAIIEAHGIQEGSIFEESSSSGTETTPKIVRVPREPKLALQSSRHEENLHILAKFLYIIEDKEGGEGVFHATSFPSRDDVNGVEERVKKMAEQLSRATLKDRMIRGLTDLVENAEPSFHKVFQKNAFKSLAKFILSVFDMEDLERHYCGDEIYADFKRFFAKNLLPLKCGQNPFKHAAEGKIELDGFPLLREQDIGLIFTDYLDLASCHPIGVEFCPLPWLMHFGLKSDENEDFFKKECLKFVEMARSVLLEFVPLEDDCKLRTAFEFIAYPRCWHLLIALGLEVVEALDLRELEKHLSSPDGLVTVAWLMERIFHMVAEERNECLRARYYCVTAALRFGSFGSFSDAVLDLIYIADTLRRLQGHRFISKQHIIRACCWFTESGVCIEELLGRVGLRVEDNPEPATYPPYRVYMSAQAIADINGEEVVAIEHMVVATVFELKEGGVGNRERLERFNKEGCVQKFFADVRSGISGTILTTWSRNEVAERIWNTECQRGFVTTPTSIPMSGRVRKRPA